MPVEIRKLVIQAKVNETQKEPLSPGKLPERVGDTELIVEACVQAVLKILEKQKLR